MPRYFFPNLAADGNPGGIYPHDGDDVHNGAVRVEPILALEDYTEWDGVGSLFKQLYNRAMFSAASRFHLFFGQLSPEEANTSSAAKYVYKLLITFSGTPVLSTDETNIALKVGSDFRMTVNIFAEDALLDGYVRDNMAWSSSNPGVVAVDRLGNLDVKAEGEAVVTASFGESSVSAVVRVGGEGGADSGASEADGSDGGVAGEQAQTAEREAVATEVGDAEAAEAEAGGAGDTEQENASMDGAGANHAFADFADAEGARLVYSLSAALMAKPENAEWANSVLSHRYIENSGEGALNNARRDPLGADARQLIVLAAPGRNAAALAVLGTGFFFALGFGYGMLRYRWQI
jgi:hypothetical protein